MTDILQILHVVVDEHRHSQLGTQRTFFGSGGTEMHVLLVEAGLLPEFLVIHPIQRLARNLPARLGDDMALVWAKYFHNPLYCQEHVRGGRSREEIA